MVKTTFFKTREDGVNLYRIYSDQNVKIKKVGTDIAQNQAFVVEGSPSVYVETDKPVEVRKPRRSE